MLPDFKLIKHKFPNNDIEIWPISDVHLGAAEHNAEAWGAFCRELEQRENAYLILGGDLINNATRSSVSNIFEETMRPREQKKRMVEMLTPLRRSWLPLTAGKTRTMMRLMIFCANWTWSIFTVRAWPL